MSQKSSVQLTPSNVPQVLTADKPAIGERFNWQNEILQNVPTKCTKNGFQVRRGPLVAFGAAFTAQSKAENILVFSISRRTSCF
jgi:hypothetical protein